MSNQTQNPEELDMRVHVPIERHRRLNLLFKDLSAGESFIFINDHDPIPLYYEFRSIFGDVVGWEYLNKGGRDWKVKVTKTKDSEGRDVKGVSTIIDLRKTDPKEWVHVVFHRYGMMEKDTTMELVSAEDPKDIHHIFINKFDGKHSWVYKKQEEGEHVVHITKKDKSGLGDDGYMLVNSFDIRPYEPAERHERFYKAFADIKAGEAFEFINDHDPLPLYYQMEAESKEPFKWEYLEKGPEVWKVKVIKIKKV